MLSKGECYYHWEMMIQSKLEVEVEEDRVRSPPMIESPSLEEATADPHHKILYRRRQQEEEDRRSNDYYQEHK